MKIKCPEQMFDCCLFRNNVPVELRQIIFSKVARINMFSWSKWSYFYV